MLQELASLNVYAFILIFARIGTMITVLPGFSATYVTRRVRLSIALGISFMMTPLLSPNLPAPPPAYLALFALIAGEMIIGAFLGAIAQVLMSALQTAGTLMALFSSLANALVRDSIAEQQSSIFSNFLSIMGITLVFVTGLHHLMLEALMSSYVMFEPGVAPPGDDFANFIAHRVTESFALGLRLAMPFVVVALIYFIGLGILGRLMPQMPVFFVGLPLQVGVQIIVLMLTLSGLFLVFLNNFREVYQPFVNG